MTYIPGTGSVGGPKIEIPVEKKTEIKPEILTAVNVQELKNPEVVDLPEPEWYFQLKYWILFGSSFSLIFLILAYFDMKALFLLPLGPYIGYLAWHIRKWIKKHSDKFDSLS